MNVLILERVCDSSVDALIVVVQVLKIGKQSNGRWNGS